MKNFTVLILLLISSLSYSQRFKEILKFQVETRAGGMVYGITESIEEAESILVDFQKRNADSKYDISSFNPIYKYTTYPIENSVENPVKKFKSLAGKNYKVLSHEDIIALDMIKKLGIDAGVDYYVKARNASTEYTIKRLNYIYSNLDNFRIKKTNYLAVNNNYIN